VTASVVSVSGIEKQSLNVSQAIINPLAFQSPRMNISQNYFKKRVFNKNPILKSIIYN
jgi:hypothetical protein